jgi:hypothetical protein
MRIEFRELAKPPLRLMSMECRYPEIPEMILVMHQRNSQLTEMSRANHREDRRVVETICRVNRIICP